ncbi:hypothetical protein NM208_g17041 [Fusarium decemcellulare]|uniref:Uncharacterized protein n=1 Tax=Fusarium decemcellulare TaxID=57161 RepID=A0ACC1RBW8_9HYPO|nr:hypothetical protein NM208_g17041 [Fusarium decemcellulare]
MFTIKVGMKSSAGGICGRKVRVEQRAHLLLGVGIGALVGELGLDLAGKLLLSSTQLEQSCSQPQNKGGPSTRSFSLGRVVSAGGLKVHVVSSSTRGLARSHSVVTARGKANLFIFGVEAQAQASAGVLARNCGTYVGVA